MVKRIIPISSGKGGVGKTSFAINLSLNLSRMGRCVLLDLDTGTSSIRNTIKTPVQRDLYHFFKKDEPLDRCISTLHPKLDPKGRYGNFGFIASPKHMIGDIANLDEVARNRMIDAINELDADYVVLDLKAGLDPGVIDFMPQSNTGILVFTPNHPAATLSASDVAKAIIFRNLRELFGPTSELFQHFPGIDAQDVNMMIDEAEDNYSETLNNLDAMVRALHRRLGKHPFVNIIYHSIQRFQVYYVLNRFSGLHESYETAVKPLVANIHANLSSRVSINNLGWVIESKHYHQANTRGVPYLLAPTKAAITKNTVERKMEELYALAGLGKKRKLAPEVAGPSTDDVLDQQLHAIEGLYDAKKHESVGQNFDYIISAIRYTMQHKKISDFGTPRLLKRGELVPLILARKRQQQSRGALAN